MCRKSDRSCAALLAAAVVLQLALAYDARGQSGCVTQMVVLKFQRCRSVDAKVEVQIRGANLTATREEAPFQDYWVAFGAPSFRAGEEPIVVTADGVPVYCSRDSIPQDYRSEGCVAVFTVDCTNGWLLEVESNPASTFRYTRLRLAGSARSETCAGANATRRDRQQLDIASNEALRVQIRSTSGEPAGEVTLTRERIQQKGRDGVLTLKGKALLLGDQAIDGAPIDGTPHEVAAVNERLKRLGLKKVTFEVK